MRDRIAMLAYKYLVRYCKYKSKMNTCKGCLFDDNRPRCGCIANIPEEWFNPWYKNKED